MNALAPLIELSDVAITHFDAAETVLIRQVNWSIGRGDFWVVGGRSSSGKSSLLLTAAGLNRPAGGSMRIFGKDLAEAKEKDQVSWRHRIGFVFEYGGRAFNHLTVAENIALPLRYHSAAGEEQIQAKVDEVLARAHLRTHAQHFPSLLSLAVQQRVALGRALSTTATLEELPEVLFLDNPLSTLSLRECRWWLDFLRQLRESPASGGNHVTIVASADDFRGWSEVADQFAVLENDRFRIVGGREQLTADQEPIIQELLGTGI